MIFQYRGIWGFDISTYQDSPLVAGHVDFEQMADTGAAFVVIRAGQGSWEDDDFKINWTAAKDVLPRASYWYFDNHYEPKAQARKYWDIIKADPEGVCWVDLEDRSGGVYWNWRCWYDFLEEFRRVSGLPYERIGIYTSYYYWIESTVSASTAQKSYFAKFPLWLAAYTPNPLQPNYGPINCPPPWVSPAILQTGTPAIGDWAGVESKDIDFDHLNGGAVEFARLFRVLPREVKNMHQGTTNQNPTKIFDIPGGSQIDQLPVNTMVRGSAPSAGYAHITYPKAGYIKILHLTGYAPIVVVTPPPPPAPEPAALPDVLYIATKADMSDKAEYRKVA
jgi:hypothetical protein